MDEVRINFHIKLFKQPILVQTEHNNLQVAFPVPTAAHAQFCSAGADRSAGNKQQTLHLLMAVL